MMVCKYNRYCQEWKNGACLSCPYGHEDERERMKRRRMKMTNAEKFTSAEDRERAFCEWCRNRSTSSCITDAKSCGMCRFSWLDLEAKEEKIEDCPYCGGECRPVKNRDEQYVVACDCCCYTSQDFASSRDAIAAHNRVARAMMAAEKKEGEEKQ